MPAPVFASGTSGDGERLLNASGVPEFVIGMNYEGPADRAWQMWDRFDAGLIDADFARAGAGGVNALRIFVQAPLATDIAADRWDKLDTVVGSAEQRGVHLVVSLHDYGELNLANVAATAGKIAQRYRGRSGILAYDLKNEPRFNDVALARYASPPPLQQRGLIDRFGERMTRADLPAYRSSDEGKKSVPTSLSEDAAWVYANNLLLYREMLADAANWVRERGFKSTTLDYLDDAAGKKWAPLVDALNGTLQAWLAPQVEAIRRADPSRPITVAHVDGVMAKLPANDVLDYQTLHRYPGTGAASVRATLSLAKTLQALHPGKPLVLGEFGYATDSVDADRAGLHESAVMLGLLAQHAAGGVKWMLNDMPEGFNMRERTLGAFRLDGTPKPVIGALTALDGYLALTGSGPGEFQLEEDPEVSLRYVYRAEDALVLGGKKVDAGSARFEANGPAELFVSWSEPGSVRLWASSRMKVTLNLPTLKSTLDLESGTRVLPAPGEKRGADYDITGGHFFTQTNGRKESAAGFSVTNADGVPLWDTFQSLGGVEVLGYPVTRRFQMDGFTVQAFQKAVLQWRPDQGNKFAFLNTFDVLHDRGRDDWLEVSRQTPRPFDTAADNGLPWDRVLARHVAFLDKVPPPLKERFLSEDDWINHYGLPVATQEYANSVVVRAQRATLQYWKEAVPWAAKGTVSVANGGDLAKEAGLYPWLAATPENAPR
ncbi:MAG TPA: cellulase family glycosylhydrolase [Chloroflexota bacterium]|nr:cellulase family glycosylhydrolase [Chloroflexota bacterium]